MRADLPAWAERSPDYGNLFNPAFLMVVLKAACEGFESEQKQEADESEIGMPFALLFLAAPLALSPDFNGQRPTALRGRLVNWLRKNPALTVDLSNAAYSLVPIVREGIIFALRTGNLRTTRRGRFQQGETDTRSQPEAHADLSDHLSNAVFAGRWLAKSGPAASILEAFGLRP